jgi:hypothetical protein
MRAAGIALCAWLVAGAAGAEPLVSGSVTARGGTPLADVQVQVEIRTVKNAASSDAQGQFHFDAAALFPPGELRDADRLMLKFSKPDFLPVNKLIRITPGQAPAPVAVQLDPTGGSAALDAAEKDTLNRYTAAPGSAPLFLIPYSLTGVAGADPKNVNEMLRANLERVIVTHLQASAVGATPAVSLKLLPVSQSGDIDRMRAYGSYLNALGMITGYGNVEPTAGGAGTLGVWSTFLVVPQADAVGAPPVLYVDDEVPADRVLSPRLYTYLSKLWGRSTVLALGVSQFRQARASHDKEALKRIRTYLQAERANVGPGDESLVSELNALLAAVDKELAQ